MDLLEIRTREAKRVRRGRYPALPGLVLAGLGLAGLAVACLSHPVADPPPPGLPAIATERCVVVEVIDRRSTTREAHGALVDASLRALGSRPYPLESLEVLLDGAEKVTLQEGRGDRSPHPALVKVMQDRLRIFRELAEEDAAAAVVVMAAPRLEGGRFSGISDLLQECPPEAPVVLALLDLVHPREVGGMGWSWRAGEVVAGTDPVAVDRIAQRILDSARRATGGPALESDDDPGDPRLARAASLLGGCADLDHIEWRKIPLTR